MNIQRVTSYDAIMRTNAKNGNNAYQRTNFGIRMTMPISSDTISFEGKKGRKALQSAKAIAAEAKKQAEALMEDTGEVTNKTLRANQRSWKININSAKRIHKVVLKPQQVIDNFIHNLFDDLVATDKNPNNPIYEIIGRPKKPYSIVEKCATRKWQNEQEALEEMTDLNGMKITMNKKTGQKETDEALDRFIPMIKTGQMELREIEVKLPEAIKGLPTREQEKYYYGSKSKLKKLVEIQESVWNGPNTAPENIRRVHFGKPQYTKGNYCATHFLLDLPNKNARPFELQLMGYYEGKGKKFDDIIFKKLDGKKVDNKYNPISKRMEVLKEDTTGALDRFKKYRKDANLALRQREIREAETHIATRKNEKLFISADKYNLPPEYDLNNLYELMETCDKNAAIASKNLEEARKAKATKDEMNKTNPNTEHRQEATFPKTIINKLFGKQRKQRKNKC